MTNSEWIQTELKFWSREPNLKKIEAIGFEINSFNARVVDWDFKKSEALFQNNKEISPLEALRISLARGYFSTSIEIIKKLNENLNGEDPGILKSELIVEETRLSIFLGDWDKAIQLAQMGISYSPTSLSLMTLLQLKALAYYEKGEFQIGLRDLEQIETLLILYPNAVCGFYARIMKAKFLSQMGFLEKAQSLLEHVWEDSVRMGPIALVHIFTYLRAQADLSRLKGQYHSSLTAGVLYFARQMGDRLYEALACCELYLSDNEPCREFTEYMELCCKEFLRVSKMMGEVKNPTSLVSTTSKTFKIPQAHREMELYHYLNDSPQKLLFSDGKILVDLNPFKIHLLTKITKPIEMAIHLSKGPISKEKVFSLVWGPQKYSARIHDPLIHQVLTSMRKIFGFEVTVLDQKIVLNKVLLIRIN